MQKIINKTVIMNIDECENHADAFLKFKKEAILQGWTKREVLTILGQASENNFRSAISTLRLYCR